MKIGIYIHSTLAKILVHVYIVVEKWKTLHLEYNEQDTWVSSLEIGGSVLKIFRGV